jgi:fused signal recognition particle receptor
MNSDIRKKSFFEKLKSGLEKTRKLLLTNVDDIILGEKVIDQRLFDELEEALIMADVGPVFTYDLIEKMKEQVKRKELERPELLKKVLRNRMTDILMKNERPLAIPVKQLYTIMVVGVNGTGKTTTIGKMAHQFKKEGRSVLLAAADTFRAAAIEQLAVWSQRVDVPLIKQQIDADPAAVVFDAMQAAKSGRGDVLIVDTAGRLHTKVNLMEELKKIKRVMAREIPGSPHEVLLVIDATNGQNAINQARMFNEEIGVTGIVLTKMDGTSKGGIVIRIASELHIPIRYIGIGEAIEDLRPFKSEDFVNALFGQNGVDGDLMNKGKRMM